jgi:hypothetical protein
MTGCRMYASDRIPTLCRPILNDALSNHIMLFDLAIDPPVLRNVSTTLRHQLRGV